MKNEVYSILKSLEALNIGIKNMWTNDLLDSVGTLQIQYSDICNCLKIHLTPEEFKMIQIVEIERIFRDRNSMDLMNEDNKRRRLLQSLLVASDMSLAYLRSLDMDLNKELIEERIKIKKQREELESKTKQVEDLQKTFESLINILSDKKSGIPELVRSRLMEGIKESHRGIESNTNPKTKSQNKVLTELEQREEI